MHSSPEEMINLQSDIMGQQKLAVPSTSCSGVNGNSAMLDSRAQKGILRPLEALKHAAKHTQRPMGISEMGVECDAKKSQSAG